MSEYYTSAIPISISFANTSNPLQQVTVTPLYADVRKNTFLIYDLIGQDINTHSLKTIKNAIWNILENKIVDDGLLLQQIDATNGCLKVIMHVLEPDRTVADFCGNGANAVASYLLQKYGRQFSKIVLVSRRGEHSIFQDKKGTCFINMGKPIVELTPQIFHHEGKDYRFTLVDAVERHLVTDNFYDYHLLQSIGEAINKTWKNQFPQGINVNCIRLGEKTDLEVMTYERGVYTITQACGTGSTGACSMAIQQNLIPSRASYQIGVLGGEIELFFENKNGFWLGGPLTIIPTFYQI